MQPAASARPRTASRGARLPLVAIALTMSLQGGGCTPRPLVERAIRARGGPLDAVVREVEAQVYVGFPGAWRWRTAFQVPDRYAWTIVTAGEPHHYLFDGTQARGFVGTRAVVDDSSPRAPLRSHARFTAVVNLDVLRLPGARVAPLPAADLGPGVAAALAVGLGGDDHTYRLGFNAESRLVRAAGPVDLAPFGAGELDARFSDFHRAHGLLVPFHTAYTFRGERLADEQAIAVCPNPPGLPADAFATPGRLPRCS